MAEVIRSRLLSVLDSPLPLLVVEAVPGGGKRTLLNQWCRESSGERRIVVRVTHATTGAQVLHLILSGLLGRADGPPTQLGSKSLIDEIRRQVARGRGPLAIAISEADNLEPAAAGVLLRLVEDDSQLRLIVAQFDGSGVAQIAARAGIAHAIIDDQDLEFTDDEVAELLAAEQLSPIPGAAAALREATQGHPGLTAAAISAFPTEAELGTVSRGSVLAVFLAGGGSVPWPSGVARFVSALIGVPRFSAQQAELITGDPRASVHLHRLRRIGLGEMAYLPAIRQRVFCWDEAVRLGIARFIEEVDETAPRVAEAVLAAARQTQDRELEAATLVATGRLAEAERLLARWLWDLLPDGPAPIWRPLQQVPPQALVDHPGLLAIRQRVGAAPSRSLPNALIVLGDRTAALSPRQPWRRLGALARGFELVRQSGDVDQIVGVAGRIRELVAELLDAAPPPADPAVCSDLLLVTQSSLHAGSTSYAAEFARHALEAIDQDPRRLDPAGTRRAFAARVLLLSHRERGLDDPVGLAEMLSGGEYVREADMVAALLAMTWGALDAGRLADAEAYTRLATTRVARPADWPALMFYRAIVLGVSGRSTELETLLQRYEQLSSWRQAPDPRPTYEVTNRLLHKVLGRELPSPNYLAVDTTAGRSGFAPRVDHQRWLFEALDALRTGRRSEARICLEKAITVLPSHPLAPLILAHASPDELRRLSGLLDGHPRAAELHLEYADEYAATSVEVAATLSDREVEVLTLLRHGATNQQIAQQLFVSVNTVKFHRANLMRKLGARSRDDLLTAASSMGL